MPLEIPEVVIDRLPVYHRLLVSLQAKGVAVVSSQELGDALNVTPAQIRKDLSYFGRFGKQGRGYSVQRLTEELQTILGLDRRWRMVLIGVDVHAAVFLEVNKPQPVVLFELVKGWVTGEMPDVGEIHQVRK